MASFGRYLITRLGLIIPVFFGVSVVAFVIQKITPGNPVLTALGITATLTPAQIAAERQILGLNEPVYIQYFKYIERLVQGNMGTSIYYRLPVSTLISQALPNTLILISVAIVIGIAIGLPLGMLTASRSRGKVDGVVRGGSVFASSVPDFWVGLILALIFGYYLRLFPLAGFHGPIYVVLPAVTLAIGVAGVITRVSRSTMLDVINLDYIRAARARGIPQRIIVAKYALRNAILPVLTVLGLQFGYLLTGAFFVEYIYAWPGLGRLTVTAIQNLDYPLVQGSIIVVAIVYVLINLVIDVTYAYVNPRIHLS
ncbi:MAG: ABC transporter permease [Nitrosopumilaceae archaeon]